MGDDGGQLDLFTVTAIDPPWRDNRDAMGYPFLSLQKRRTTPIIYEDGNVWLSVGADSRFGIATIWDWDVMIFAASHINEAIENRRQISPEIAFVPHDCLKQIGRHTGGGNYHELAQAIRRLHATSVITNIREADQPEIGEERGFHWLYGYSLPKRYPPRYITTPDNITHITPRNPEGEPDPARPWAIHIHPWLYNAIVRQGDILAVHPDYFQLTGGLERWLYRLARKSVPDKADPPAIRFKMETLHARSGVTGTLNRFAFRIRQIAETQPLPEYGVQIEHRRGRRELVTLHRDKAKPYRPPRGRRLKTIRGEPLEPTPAPVRVRNRLSEEEMAAAVLARLTELEESESPTPLAIPHKNIPAVREQVARVVEQLTSSEIAELEAKCSDPELRRKLRETREANTALLNRLCRLFDKALAAGPSRE